MSFVELKRSYIPWGKFDPFRSCFFTVLGRTRTLLAQSRAIYPLTTEADPPEFSPSCLWILRFPSLVGRNKSYSQPVRAPATAFQVAFPLVLGRFLTHTHWSLFNWILRGLSDISRVLSPCSSVLSSTLLSTVATLVLHVLKVASPHLRESTRFLLDSSSLSCNLETIPRQ